MPVRMVSFSMSLSDHGIFEVECQKDKVTIAQEETIPNIWNGTMFDNLN